MLFTLLIQVALPVALIGWMALLPASSMMGYLAQALGTGLVLLAIALVALWMLLPWWLPWCYGLLWIVAITNRLRLHRFVFKQRWPSKFATRFSLFAICALGAYAGQLSWQALQGRNFPDVAIVDMQLPLGPGTYLVANGGSREIVNGHMMTLNSTVERYRAYRGQSYGVDLIEIDRFGLHASGIQPRDPEAYRIYGKPVYSPCDGTVLASRNDRPDMPVPIMDLAVIEGNHVLLNCDRFVVLLAHFRPGSVVVLVGDQVKVGMQLGVIGNSGKTSEPHLHISAQLPGTPAEPLSGDPLAMTFAGRHVVRNDRIRADP